MSWGDGGREPISASAGYVTVILLTQIFFLFVFFAFSLFVFISRICYCHFFTLLLSDVVGSDFNIQNVLHLVYCG